MIKGIILRNHPNFNSVSRTTDMVGLKWDKISECIQLEMRVNHFLEGNPAVDMDRTVDLTINNTNQFPTGDIILKDAPLLNEDDSPMLDEENNPVLALKDIHITMGDYEFFKASVADNMGFVDMVTIGITQMDNIGTFNTACNYKS